MGSTLEKYSMRDPNDPDVAAKRCKDQRAKDLLNWPPTIAGIPVVPASSLPTPELAAICGDSINSTDELSAIDYMWHDFEGALDAGLPEGTPFMTSVPPIFDATFAIPFDPFLSLMVNIGIPDPVPFVIANLEGIGDPITKLAACDIEGFVEDMQALDPNINAEKAAEEAEKICPFEIPTLEVPFPPEIPIPNFSLSITPIELVLPDINFEFPQLHISIMWLLQELINAIIKLMADIMALVLKIIEGIMAFIIACVEFLINIIIEIIMALLEPIMKFIEFFAGIITIIAMAIRTTIGLIVCNLIGAGLIGMAVFDALES